MSKLLTNRRFRKFCPILNCEDILGGSFGGRDGFINPLAVMRGFTKEALENGAKIEFDTEVFSIESKSGRVTAVETSRGRIECEKVLLCAGAWARNLAKTAGVDLPVEPLKRQNRLGEKRNSSAGKFADGD